MLQQLVDSGWHMPAVAIMSSVVLFLVLCRRTPFIQGFCFFFGLLIVLDSWFAGPLSPLTGFPKTATDMSFVWIGDWRFFLLIAYYRSGRTSVRTCLQSIVLASIVPAVALTIVGIERSKLDLGAIFLIYETTFLVLLPLALFVSSKLQPTVLEGRSASFLKALTRFEVLQYALWASADVLLLMGQSWAMALRMSANIFYYSLFVPYVWWRSPDSPDRKAGLAPIAGIALAAFAFSFAPLALHRNAPQPAPAAESSASLTFLDGGKPVSTMSLEAMTQSSPVEQISAFDPYYKHNKRWRAIGIEKLLALGFKRDPAQLTGQEFVLRASDGFAAYFPGARLLEGGAYVAIEDLDTPGWEPIGERKDNPGPFYLIWSKPNQQDLETHARPWQLASIEIVTFDSQFPHVRPEGNVSSAATQGFEVFRVQCLPCHSINRSGGKVGPELNVPRNILEYRDPSVLRAFIRNPQSFRYTIMPAHPDMTAQDLDDVIAYFGVMKNQKHDQ